MVSAGSDLLRRSNSEMVVAKLCTSCSLSAYMSNNSRRNSSTWPNAFASLSIFATRTPRRKLSTSAVVAAISTRGAGGVTLAALSATRVSLTDEQAGSYLVMLPRRERDSSAAEAATALACRSSSIITASDESEDN